jgi:hypothetical protein
LLVTITEKNSAGAVINTAYAAAVATASDAALAAVAISALSTPKGTLLSGATVASFTDADPTAPVGDFAATIDWGDGTPASIGVVSQPGGAGTAFVVKGNHTYALDRATPYPVTVSIRDRGGAVLTVTTQATVVDVAPLVSGIPVAMTPGQFFSDPVAYIVEAPGAAPEPPGHYTATINWGDNSAATAGTIEAVPGGAWVVGSHTYGGSGPYTVTVTVQPGGGATVMATTTAYDPPARVDGPPVTASPTPIGALAGSTSVSVPAGPRQHRHRRAHQHGHHGNVAERPGMERPRQRGMRHKLD